MVKGREGGERSVIEGREGEVDGREGRELQAKRRGRENQRKREVGGRKKTGNSAAEGRGGGSRKIGRGRRGRGKDWQKEVKREGEDDQRKGIKKQSKERPK